MEPTVSIDTIKIHLDAESAEQIRRTLNRFHRRRLVNGDPHIIIEAVGGDGETLGPGSSVTVIDGKSFDPARPFERSRP